MNPQKWLPNLITLLLAAALIVTQQAWASPLAERLSASASTLASPSASSKTTINYQGYLTDASGNPVNGTVDMVFRLYDVERDGTALWAENQNDVAVTDGMFSVLLGSEMPIAADLSAAHDDLWLGIAVGADNEMLPREKLGSTLYAVQALTLPDEDLPMSRHWVTDTHGLQYVTAPHDGLTLVARGDSDGIRLVSDGSVHMWIDGNNSSDNAVFQVHADQTCHCPGQRTVFTVSEDGSLSASGTKSAVVQAGAYGSRKLYSAESPEVRFFDEGMAQLQKGIARIELDPIFLETIEGQFLIHITPYGDAGLYVAEVGEDFFIVKAHRGDPDVAFAWRLSAHRKGYSGLRLETVDYEEVTELESNEQVQ